MRTPPMAQQRPGAAKPEPPASADSGSAAL